MRNVNIPEKVENQIETAIKAWRTRAQTRMMSIGLILVLPAVIHTVFRAIGNPRERFLAFLFVLFYLGIALVNSWRDLDVQIRGWVLMLLIYFTGLLAMVRGGLAGDGRVYLLLLPVLGVVLVNKRCGFLLALTSMTTFVVFGFLAHFGVLEHWLIVIDNPITYEHWLYDGLVFIAFLGIAIFVLADFYNYLIKTLVAEYENAARLREAHKLLDQANLRLEDKVKQRTSELAAANKRLQHLADHDPLTGLPNRVLFYRHLENSILQARNHNRELAVLFIDLDNFKAINDTFGHAKGDELLQEVSKSLKSNLRESDTVARLSGDEFAVIVEQIASLQDAIFVARKLLENLSTPFELSDSTVELSASIGISVYPIDGEDPDTLVGQADSAMYRVKHTTKAGFQFYSLQEI
jgi:diguanylate cyclase (GGDEF)-like protein